MYLCTTCHFFAVLCFLAEISFRLYEPLVTAGDIISSPRSEYDLFDVRSIAQACVHEYSVSCHSRGSAALLTASTVRQDSLSTAVELLTDARSKQGTKQGSLVS